jgi:hypothetical protein
MNGVYSVSLRRCRKIECSYNASTTNLINIVISAQWSVSITPDHFLLNIPSVMFNVKMINVLKQIQITVVSQADIIYTYISTRKKFNLKIQDADTLCEKSPPPPPNHHLKNPGLSSPGGGGTPMWKGRGCSSYLLGLIFVIWYLLGCSNEELIKML